MTVESINLTLVLSIFLVEYLCAYYSIRFDSMTFNVKSKSLYLRYIMCKHIEPVFSVDRDKANTKNQISRIKSSYVHTSDTYSDANFLRTFQNWKCKKASISPNSICSCTRSYWLLSLTQHSNAVHCIQKEEKLIKRLAVCNWLCICVCATSFSGPTEIFFVPLFPAVKAFRWHWVNEMENWRQKCVPRVTQHNLFRLFVITITLQFFSHVIWLVGWMFCLLASTRAISVDSTQLKPPVDSVTNEHLFQSQFKTQQFSLMQKKRTFNPIRIEQFQNFAAASTAC